MVTCDRLRSSLLFIEEGNGNPLQYSFLGDPMDRGAWQDIVHGVEKDSKMTE